MVKIKDIWSNETYGNWLVNNGVPDKIKALCQVKIGGHAKQFIPVKVVAISKDFAGTDLIVPKDGNQYQIIGYVKLENNKFAIGINEK